MKNLRINEQAVSKLESSIIDREESTKMTGFASIDRPWLKYYSIRPEDVVIPEMSLYEFVYDFNKDNLNGIALNYYHHRITYRELFDKVERFAYKFKKMGIKKDDVVSICSLTTPEMLYSFLALNKIGASVNMIDPRTGVDGLKQYIDDAKSRVLITLDVFSEKFNSFINNTNINKIISFSIGDSLPKIQNFIFSLKMKNKIKPFEFNGEIIEYQDMFDKDFEPVGTVDYDQNRLASIVYTGGTTGKPKSVMLSNENYVAMAIQYSKLDLDMRRGETFLSIIPPFFPYGICSSLYVPLSLGLETIIIPKFDASIFPDVMMEYKPNHVNGVPKYWENLMKSKKGQRADLSFLKNAGCGGDGMNDKLEMEINDFFETHGSSSRVIKGYGMTEMSATAAVCTHMCNKTGSVGIPFICNNISVFEPNTDHELSYLNGDLGELCITGPGMMLGYKDDPVATEELIHVHSDGKSWVHTGDCGYIDEDGNVFINGRYKRLILRRGMSIYPLSIENIIMQSEYVDSVSVVAMSHPDLVNVPVVCFTLKEQYKSSLDLAIADIRELCCRNLPDYSIPFGYMVMEEIPRTQLGKVDFVDLERTVNLEKPKVKKLVI